MFRFLFSYLKFMNLSSLKKEKPIIIVLGHIKRLMIMYEDISQQEKKTRRSEDSEGRGIFVRAKYDLM